MHSEEQAQGIEETWTVGMEGAIARLSERLSEGLQRKGLDERHPTARACLKLTHLKQRVGKVLRALLETVDVDDSSLLDPTVPHVNIQRERYCVRTLLPTETGEISQGKVAPAVEAMNRCRWCHYFPL